MKCRPNIEHYQSCAIPTITRSNWQNKQPFVAHVVKFQAMGMKLPCSQTGNCDPAAARWTSQTSQLVGGEEQQFKKKKKDKKHHVEQRWPSVLPFSSKLLLNKTDFFPQKQKKKLPDPTSRVFRWGCASLWYLVGSGEGLWRQEAAE